MIRDCSHPPKDLLAEISRDLQPVKPAPVPSRLALQLLPLALLISSAILSIIGPRRDAATIGPLLTWGASLAQFSVGVILVWVAARESTPSRRLPLNIVCSVVAATCLIVAAVALRTFAASPTVVPPGHSAWTVGFRCGMNATIAGTLLVILFAWFFRHSLAGRPTLAGALYGGGAGVSVNAGWRLACPVSAPSHSLIAHGMAIAATMLLGSLAAHLIARRLRRPVEP
jgi:hypothetical protein